MKKTLNEISERKYLQDFLGQCNKAAPGGPQESST